jgi:hypothetical protein
MNVQTDRERILADNVVAELSPEMFNIPFRVPTGYVDFVPDPFTVGEDLVIPYWVDDSIRVEYLNLRTSQRVVHVEGADEIIRRPSTQFNIVNPLTRFWSLEEYPTVVWTSGEEGGYHVSWMSPSNGEVYHLDDLSSPDNLADVRNPQGHFAGWWSYLSKRDNSFHLVNVNNNEHLSALQRIKSSQRTFAAVAPRVQDKAIVVVVDMSALSASGNLYLVKGADEYSPLLDSYAGESLIWSPDDLAIAYIHRNVAARKLSLHVLNGDGHLRYSIPLRGYDIQHLLEWTQCQ